MKVQAVVRQETAKIAAGVGVLSALMVAVYLIIGRFDVTVLLGALLGTAFAILNFFLMALSVQHATDSMDGVQGAPVQEPAEGEEPIKHELSPEATRAGRSMQRSYLLRMAMLAAMAVLALQVPAFDPVAALVPLLFPRIVILLRSMFEKKETRAQ